MFNMQTIMKQAQMMQQKMEAEQAKLGSLEVIGQSGGGAVKVTLSGKFDMKNIEISAAATEDKEMLQDLIMAAYKDAKTQADEITEKSMKGVTGGLNIPGLKF